MEPALLDTDILSELLRAKAANVVGRGKDYLRRFGHYTTSVVTVVELVRGFQKAGQTNRIDNLVRSLTLHEILSLDQNAAIIAGRISGQLQRTGETIGQADPMIAAIAIRHDLLLVTGNSRHFDRIIRLGLGLRVDDWRS